MNHRVSHPRLVKVLQSLRLKALVNLRLPLIRHRFHLPLLSLRLAVTALHCLRHHLNQHRNLLRFHLQIHLRYRHQVLNLLRSLLRSLLHFLLVVASQPLNLHHRLIHHHSHRVVVNRPRFHQAVQNRHLYLLHPLSRLHRLIHPASLLQVVSQLRLVRQALNHPAVQNRHHSHRVVQSHNQVALVLQIVRPCLLVAVTVLV